MSDESKSALDAAQERREARKAELRKAAEAQRAKDLDTLTDLEIEHGDSNVGAVTVPFSPGMPTLVIVRCPKPVEVKRFRALTKADAKGRQPDALEPLEQLARACLLFPDAETYARICESRPVVAGQVGAKAVDLASARDESEIKG